jgi:ribosomal protein S18 acetylase RimI-like enzyme/predicted nuclease with RNAse H fold
MVELRDARDEDEAGLRGIDAATWSPRVSPGARPEPGREFLARHDAENVIVAVDGEAPVGFLILGTWTDLESARHVLVFNGLAVDPERQGEGIGSRLLDAGIERARERGARRVLLRVLSTNDGARRLYERHGFTVEAALRGVFHLEGAYADDLFMAFDLTREPARRELARAAADAPATTAVGIDVGGRRKGFHACAMRGDEVVAGPDNLADVDATVAWVTALDPSTVALDSPKTCAPAGESSRADERALARAVCGIRWTPERSKLAGNPYYEWVEHGLELYASLAAAGIPDASLIEVFPTAAWTIWAGPRGKVRRADWSAAALADLGLAGVPDRHLSQDDRDAIAAALVARLHDEGRTDAYGEIKVPARAPASAPPAG